MLKMVIICTNIGYMVYTYNCFYCSMYHVKPQTFVELFFLGDKKRISNSNDFLDRFWKSKNRMFGQEEWKHIPMLQPFFVFICNGLPIHTQFTNTSNKGIKWQKILSAIECNFSRYVLFILLSDLLFVATAAPLLCKVKSYRGHFWFLIT